MRKLFVLTAVSVSLLVACNTSTVTPPPPPASATAGTPSPTKSPSPPPSVINGCTIKPGTDCSGADLRGAPLAGASLKGSTFTKADLYGADMRKVDLHKADLTEADLRNVDMTGANLTGANLTDANLEHANLFEADLEGATINNAQFVKAARCNTVRPDGTQDDADCADIGTSPSPKPAAKPVEITKFVITPGDVQCATPKDTPDVRIKYSVKNADEVNFLIDQESLGQHPAWDPKKGTADLPFNCKDDKHVYTIEATDANGKPTRQAATVHQTA